MIIMNLTLPVLVTFANLPKPLPSPPFPSVMATNINVNNKHFEPVFVCCGFFERHKSRKVAVSKQLAHC